MMARNELTRTGIYIIVALIILKFVITPLNGKLKEKREIMQEIAQSLSLKKDIYERKLAEIELAKKTPKSLQYIYDKKYSYNSIRNVVLNWLMDEAEKKGLSVVNFELPEIKKGKVLSEISVTIRFKGKMKPFLDYLEIVEQTDKLLLIKNLDISKTGQDMNIAISVSFFRSEI